MKLASFFLLKLQREVPTCTSAEWSKRKIYYYLYACAMPWDIVAHHEGHLKYLLWNFVLYGRKTNKIVYFRKEHWKKTKGGNVYN